MSWDEAFAQRYDEWSSAMTADVPFYVSLAEQSDGPIAELAVGNGHRWVQAIGRRAGLGSVRPHMLRAGFIMAALDAGVPLRDVQLAARHADPRTTTVYDRRRKNFNRHAAYVAGG